MLPCIILYYTLFTVYIEERMEFSHILYTPQECNDTTLRPEQFHFVTWSSNKCCNGLLAQLESPLQPQCYHLPWEVA